ncbi:iron chaperone [Absicoccus porci]|jgi:uncharacterized protein YdhG (YjbR/CyaY superfamily)|uniref:iron chaperone n=1 Tax=Absicoccus porci TaxID=2486576 RepID=UPI003D8DA36C
MDQGKDQSRLSGKKPKTVDEYMLSYDEPIRKQLLIVRNCLNEALPNTTEKISWSMPTYWNQHTIIHFAANKNHIGLYPGVEAVKGSIQIPYSNELPCDLIKEIAIWCYERRNQA